jgi:hypothetical protein
MSGRGYRDTLWRRKGLILQHLSVVTYRVFQKGLYNFESV